MFIPFSLKAGVATALAVCSLGSAQAAVEYFATYGSANGIVIDGSAANERPVAQRNLFLDALDLSKVTRENFDKMKVGEIGLGTSTSIFGGGATLTATDGETIPGTARVRENPFDSAGTFLGRFNTTGDPQELPKANFVGSWWESSARTNTIRFTTPVMAFGLFLTDLGDFDGSMDLVISNSEGGDLLSRSLVSEGNNTANGSLSFFGYVADSAFDTLVFTLTQKCGIGGCDSSTYDFVGFDDFITGPLKNGGPTPAPEPTSLALVGLSLGLLGLSRRRKTSA